MSTPSQGKPLYRRYIEKQQEKQNIDPDYLTEGQLDCVWAGAEDGLKEDSELFDTQPKNIF